MFNFTLLFILVCFAAQIVLWLFLSRSTKRTSENRGGWLMRVIAIVVVVLVIFFQDQIATFIPFFNTKIWPQSLATGVLADIVTLFGLMVMIWSRLALGENWSANVTLKENHELITTGPYAYVRHPIYSGLILMVLGVTIYSGSLAWVFFLIIFFLGAYYKAYKEESLLSKHFPNQYAGYKKRVCALIPFIF